jgi:hypothetical protein
LRKSGKCANQKEERNLKIQKRIVHALLVFKRVLQNSTAFGVKQPGTNKFNIRLKGEFKK